MNDTKEKYYDRVVDLVIYAFNKIHEDKSFIKGNELSKRQSKMLIKEHGASFTKENILFSNKFLLFTPTLVVKKDEMYNYYFCKNSLKSKILKFKDIKEIYYSVMPLCTKIEIVFKNGSRRTVFDYIPRGETYSDVKDYDKDVKSGRYKTRTVCYMLCIYSLSAISNCSLEDCSKVLNNIENNIKLMINEFSKKQVKARLYGDLLSFDFVHCCYKPEVVEQGLRKIAEVKGEVLSIRREELRSTTSNTVGHIINDYENQRQKVIKNVEQKIKEAEHMGVDVNRINVAKEKLATFTGNARNDTGFDNLRDIYANAPKVSAQLGTERIAFVFSCPGQKEEQANQVCYGCTGENLQILISYCNEKRPDVFTSSSKNDYTITNASDRVHYFSLTHDTEASYDEIKLTENIERLKLDLMSANIVVCMGDKAFYAVRLASVSAKIVKGEHLSAMHLNRTYKSNSNSSFERRVDRIKMVADKILTQI